MQVKKYIIVLVVLFLGTKSSCYAQAPNNKLIAALIYNFTKQIEWPSEATKTTMIIGIIGDTEVQAELLKIASHKNNANYQLIIKPITVEESTTCNIVFIGNAASDKVPAIDKLTRTLPILTITEKQDYAKKDACISFFVDTDDMKTKFQLNRKLTEAKKLIVSNQLKALSILVN